MKRRFKFWLNLAPLAGKTILDLGCGVGAYTKFVNHVGAGFVTGLDMNRNYLLKVESAERVNSSGCVLPFQDSSFDVVLMVEVLDHLPDESKALSEARRVLKNNGLLLMSCPNKFYPFETHGLRIYSTDIGNIFGAGIPFLSWMPSNIRRKVERARIYSQNNLIKLLYKQGFEILRIDYMMPPLDGKLKNRQFEDALRSVLGSIELTPLRYFGCHILILARRF